MDQLRAASPDTSNNAANTCTEDLNDVSPIVRDRTTSNDSVSASAPSVPNQSFANRYPVRQCRPPDRYGIPPPSN